MKLSETQKKELLQVLQTRFEDNKNRHTKIVWSEVQKRLKVNEDTLWSLNEMEQTGGEPDVIGFDVETNQYIFCDCSAESPIGRRSLCYDRKALDARKANKPKNSVMDMADFMGIEVLDEEQYRKLQELGSFDTKTSSWIKTPDTIRSLGGALFCDYRYQHVFVYHNGADSYYSNRGFRGMLRM